MNILTQIDDVFTNYIKIHGPTEVDSYWDEGIVVNKYIHLGTGRGKIAENGAGTNDKPNFQQNGAQSHIDLEGERRKDLENHKSMNETHVTKKEQNEVYEKIFAASNLCDEKNSTLGEIDSKKENLSSSNGMIEECLCLNKINNLDELKDIALVRWTCMVQQIISPESYLGIYKLINKKNGQIILKSSKYRDYIDTDENWEIIEDDEKRNIDEYYESNYEQYCNRENQEDAIKNKINQTDDKNIQLCNNLNLTRAGKNENNNGYDELDQKMSPQNNYHTKKEDYIMQSKNDSIQICGNDNNFKKYWKRYLFLCTNIPGNKSSWCKQLCDYSSYNSSCENFLKSINDVRNVCSYTSMSHSCGLIKDNYKSNDGSHYPIGGSHFPTDDVQSSRETICSSDFEAEEDRANDHPTDSSLINMNPKDDQNEQSYDSQKKNKIRCIIKIYDDNSQYNGKNENNFLKLNDIIEIIGIYRKHQIRDYEDCEKNFNFYFYYDQNFLKYPCIHVFQYVKINYFNPLSSCILFKNELSNILENGPFGTISELRKHLLLHISNSFSHDLLVAHYFFFYLCGSYIKESKLKLGKISLNIFNISNEENKKNVPDLTAKMEETPKKITNEVANDTNENITQSLKNYEHKKGTKDKKVQCISSETLKIVEFTPNEFHKKCEKDSEMKGKCKKEKKRDYPWHVHKMNTMIKNLVPLYRYIPLSIEKLSSEYLMSVMNHENGELKKGKLQLANNTYLVFDECLLETGKLNNISTKNFLCIERLITSQEIAFIFNTDITFETQNNILILSKKKSMFVNYVDIPIPIYHKRGKGYIPKNQNAISLINKTEENENEKNKLNEENISKNGKQKNEQNTEGRADDDTENCSNTNESASSTRPKFSTEFINTYKNYKPNENELMQFRRYINYILSKNHSAKIHPNITTYITDSFVSLRQKGKDINQFVLNSWICMARILAFSDGSDEINKGHWDYIMKLEAERRLRLSHLDVLYV
ncbi:hypothetical protein, conserved [Plasmodium gonderi]|uniref:Mini-chromosome maintenance complex-binding protein n=1 Tax=Plasmodium gonderi TaxID=77519 RepID=A0A1Y1JNS0_PLAGO|nr:hypothetical protein, conserved [Plasmodium gonderi]GAW83095.1 hypothetical protein, conserved [Plasmodium gonderi]